MGISLRFLFVSIICSILVASSHSFPARFTIHGIQGYQEPKNYNQGDSFIRKTCNKTNNYNLCVSTLESDPNSKNVDLRGMVRITLIALSAKANESAHGFGGRVDVPSHKLYPKVCYGELYRLAFRNIPNARRALESSDFGEMERNLQNVTTIAKACNGGLVKSPPLRYKEEFLVLTQKVIDLSLLALSLLSLLG